MVGIEVRINSNLIHHIYILNITQQMSDYNPNSLKYDGMDVYKINVYMVEKGAVISFELKHIRSEGLEKLMFLVYQKLLQDWDYLQLKKK